MPDNFVVQSIFDDEIRQQAEAFSKANDQYDKNFNDWVERVPPLGDEYFWIEMRRFQKVLSCKARYRCCDVVSYAANEYFRQAQCASLKDFASAAHFALTYKFYVSQADVICRNVKGWGHADYSDDGFSDLCDSMPMIGQKLFDDLIDGKFFENPIGIGLRVRLQKLKDEVHKACPDYSKLLLGGENYFSMKLKEELQMRMKHLHRIDVE